MIENLIKNASILNILLLLFFIVFGYVSTTFIVYNFIGFDSLNDSHVVTEDVVIVLTEEGYVPAEITITKGTRVEFRNETGRPHWPSSNLHPSHEIYPEFDPKRPLAEDETWSFVFDKVGVWGMHDHIRSYYIGTIHVIEN